MKLELVKQLRGTSQITLSGPKGSWASRETSLKSLALSGTFSLISVTTLTDVPIFLRNDFTHFTLEPAHRLLWP